MTVSVPGTAWAENTEDVEQQEEHVTLQYDAGELALAVREAAESEEAMEEEWSWNTDSGAALADKYQELFETGKVREVLAEYEGDIPDEAEVRVFVKDEKVIFLLTNDSESGRAFRISVGNAATPEITLAGRSEIVDLEELEKDEVEIKGNQETGQPEDEEEKPVATGSDAGEGNTGQAEDGQSQDSGKQEGQAEGGQGQDGGKQEGQAEGGQGQDSGKQEGQAEGGQGQDGGKQEGQAEDGQGQDDGKQEGQAESVQGQDGGKQEGQAEGGQGQDGGKQEGQAEGGQGQDGGKQEGQAEGGQGQDDGKQEGQKESSQRLESGSRDNQEPEPQKPDPNEEQGAEGIKDESNLLSISRNQVPMVTASELEAAAKEPAAEEPAAESDDTGLEENAGKSQDLQHKKTAPEDIITNNIEEDSGLQGNNDTEELPAAIESTNDLDDTFAAEEDKTVLEGRLYGSFVSDEGSRGRAFVTTLARIDALADKEPVQSKIGTLKLYHILNAEGQLYYETQEVALAEEDFDETGSYYYGGQAYQNRTGLQAATPEESMKILRTQFSKEAGLEQQAMIEYRILDGFKVEGQEASPSEASPMAMYFRSARSGPAAREGFPAIVAFNSTLIEVADHTQYIFSEADAGSFGAQAGVKRYTVSDGTVFTLADEQNSSGTGSSVIVSKDVTNLTLILGSGDRNLTLDASGTEYAGLLVEAGARLTLVLADGRTAVIKGGYDRAGVELEGPVKVQDLTSDGRSHVTIRGEGTLKAYGQKNKGGQADNGGGAGIGGRGFRPNGEVTIESGTIVAAGAGGGAGIGGGGSGTAGANGDAQFGTAPYERQVDYSGGIITVTGGHVTASGDINGSGAGLGGGNHGDGGRTTIEGSAYVEARGGGGGGAGIGSGKGSHQWDRLNGVRKNGPGYFHGGEITIGGSAYVKAVGGWNSAGLGGGYCADSGKVVIEGGIVEAYGTGGNNNAKNHGGAAIGGGYEGHGDVLITDGKVTALADSSGGSYNGAAGIGSGATPNAAPERGDKGKDKGTNRGEEASLTKTTVVIRGGKIEARGGIIGGAGIGAGFGADFCEIAIEDGDVTSYGGGEYPENGGAGIGSARYDTNIKYNCETKIEDISITGGKVVSTGAWGASGIGSGASNGRAEQITIGDEADVVAYADGTKFAVDTFDRTKGEEERVINHAGARILQGTFMDLSGQVDEDHDYTALEVNIYQDLAPASGESAVVSGKKIRSINKLPKGYRSFAASVRRDGDYLVKAGKTNPDESLFCFDTAAPQETSGNGTGNHTLHYQTTANHVGDHFWLYKAENVTEDKKPDDNGNSVQKPENGGNPGGDNNGNQNGGGDGGTTDSGDNDSGDNDTGGGRFTGNTGAGGPGTVTIEDSPVPLASLPTDPSPKLYMIDDEDVPLAALPKTGNRGNGPVKALFLGSILAGVYLALNGKRKDEI